MFISVRTLRQQNVQKKRLRRKKNFDTLTKNKYLFFDIYL